MKQNVFEICSLIYDEQKAVGAQLHNIEREVTRLRRNFTEAILNNRSYKNSTFEDVDYWFDKQE